MIKNWIKEYLFNRLGYDVLPMNYWWQPEHLNTLGFHPQTVFDVGVGYGTPTLYATYPDAYFVLIEPLVEFEPHLAEILGKVRGQSFLTAVGDHDGQRTINLEPRHRQQSSFFMRTSEPTGDPLSLRSVPVTTLDALLAAHDFQPPFGLKLDTEGCEAQAILGASQLLQETQFVIAEVAVADRFAEGYSFAELISLMDQNRFRLGDVLMVGRSRQQTMEWIDLVFRKA